MKQIENHPWEQLFGDTPATFEHRVESTVDRLRRQERRAVKPRLVPVLALAIVLLAGVALALGSLGVLDTLTQNLRSYLQPGAQELVQSGIVQTGGALKAATFTIEEAINDGRQIYVTVRVKAADPQKTLLIDEQAEASWGMEWWKAGDMQVGQTYSANAHETGRDLVRGSLWLDTSAETLYELDTAQVHYDGEDILYTLTLTARQDGLEAVALQAFTYNVYGDDLPDAQRRQHGPLQFTVPLTDARTLYAAPAPVELPKAGLILDVLQMEQTPIATYLTATYRLAPDATDLQALTLRDGIWINWLDEDGVPIPDGQATTSLRPAGEDGYTLTIAYRAMDALPQAISLEFYSGMSKQRFDTPSIAMEKIEGETK